MVSRILWQWARYIIRNVLTCGHKNAVSCWVENREIYFRFLLIVWNYGRNWGSQKITILLELNIQKLLGIWKTKLWLSHSRCLSVWRFRLWCCFTIKLGVACNVISINVETLLPCPWSWHLQYQLSQHVEILAAIFHWIMQLDEIRLTGVWVMGSEKKDYRLG